MIFMGRLRRSGGQLRTVRVVGRGGGRWPPAAVLAAARRMRQVIRFREAAPGSARTVVEGTEAYAEWTCGAPRTGSRASAGPGRNSGHGGGGTPRNGGGHFGHTPPERRADRQGPRGRLRLP